METWYKCSFMDKMSPLTGCNGCVRLQLASNDASTRCSSSDHTNLSLPELSMNANSMKLWNIYTQHHPDSVQCAIARWLVRKDLKFTINFIYFPIWARLQLLIFGKLIYLRTVPKWIQKDKTYLPHRKTHLVTTTHNVIWKWHSVKLTLQK